MMCPCGSKIDYQACCGVFIDAKAKPQTPEQLMRSRYTAYTKANMDYIARTMKAPANLHFDSDSAKKWALNVEWISLEVIKSSALGKKGWVEFIANYKVGGKNESLHEMSEFRREQGEWFYVNGELKS